MAKCRFIPEMYHTKKKNKPISTGTKSHFTTFNTNSYVINKE